MSLNKRSNLREKHESFHQSPVITKDNRIHWQHSQFLDTWYVKLSRVWIEFPDIVLLEFVRIQFELLSDDVITSFDEEGFAMSDVWLMTVVTISCHVDHDPFKLLPFVCWFIKFEPEPFLHPFL